MLENYAYDQYCLANDLLMAGLSNQKYNPYLKELADLCCAFFVQLRPGTGRPRSWLQC